MFRQRSGDVLWVCLHAGAGYGKSYLLCAFLDLESKAHRRWAVLAPSGVAAQNIGGMIVHYFFLMKPDYTSALKPDPEAAIRIESLGSNHATAVTHAKILR